MGLFRYFEVGFSLLERYFLNSSQLADLIRGGFPFPRSLFPCFNFYWMFLLGCTRMACMHAGTSPQALELTLWGITSDT